MVDFVSILVSTCFTLTGSHAFKSPVCMLPSIGRNYRAVRLVHAGRWRGATLVT